MPKGRIFTPDPINWKFGLTAGLTNCYAGIGVIDGGKAFYDLTGRSAPAPLNASAKWAPSIIDSLSVIERLSGASNLLSFPSIPIPGRFTIACVARFDAIVPGSDAFLNGAGFNLSPTSSTSIFGTIRFTGNNSQSCAITTTANSQLGRLVMPVLSYDGTALRGYFNGVPGSATNIVSNPELCTIGSYTSSVSPNALGMMALWERALSLQEIKGLYADFQADYEEFFNRTSRSFVLLDSGSVPATAEPDLVEILVSPQTLTVSGSATAEPTLRGIYLSPCDVPGEYYPPEYFPPDYFCFPPTEPFNLATGGATVSLADVSIPVTPLDPEALVSVVGEASLAELEVIPQDPTAAVGITAEVEESSLTVTPQDPTATGKAEASPELGEITVSPLDPEFAVDVTANPEIGVLEVLPLDVTASGTSPITANPELAELVVTPLDVTASGATASIAEPEEAELLISPLDAEALGEALATLDPVEILVSPQDPSASGASPITANPELAELLVTPQDASSFAEALVDLDETGLVVTAYDPSADVGTIARPLIGSLLVEAQDPGVEANAEIGLDAAEIQLIANDPTAFVSITASLDLLSLLIDPEELAASGFAEIELVDVSILVQPYDPLADGQVVSPGIANPGLVTLEVTPQSFTTTGYANALPDPVSIFCAVYDPGAQGETHIPAEANPEFLALVVQPYDPLADGQVISPGVANPGSVDLVISLPDLEVTGSAVAQLGELTITISAWDPAASGETHIPAEANPGLADVQIQPWGPKATGNITLNYYENMIASWGQIVIPAGTVGEFLWPVYLVDVIEENPATEVDIHPLISINGRPYQDAVNALQPLQGESGSYLLKLDPSELPPYGNVRILVNSEAIKAFKSTVAVVAWSPDNNSEAGEIPVDHSYGEKDGLQFVDEQGNPIAGASIQVYRAEDYASNQISPPYVQGRSQTGLDGRWVAPVMLFPGEYQVVFSDQFKHSISAALVVVE